MSAMDLEDRYRRMLRWYPRQWRSRNEDAVTGVLLDQAEDQGRTAPSAGERLSLAAGGLHERFLRSERPSPLHLAALGTALAFSVWYLAVITWAPGTRFAGTLGPFTNPAVITSALLAIALVLAATDRLQLARVVSLISAVSAVVLHICAQTIGWLGPGAAPTIVFAGLALAATMPRGGRRMALALPPAVLLVALAFIAFRMAQYALPAVLSAQFFVSIVIGFAASVGALTLVLMAANPRAAASAPG